VFCVTWTSLNEKLISPALKRLERVRNGDIVDQDAAVGTPVERNAKTLEALLTGRVPDLQHFKVPALPQDILSANVILNLFFNFGHRQNICPIHPSQSGNASKTEKLIVKVLRPRSSTLSF